MLPSTVLSGCAIGFLAGFSAKRPPFLINATAQLVVGERSRLVMIFIIFASWVLEIASGVFRKTVECRKLIPQKSP